ncbi:hypothetical protein [Pelobium manganitolerans]|nr:hypothetical protein [Pelobium manganitolerans]
MKKHLLRSICVYILLLTLTFQSLYRCIMTADYELYVADYIAQCINKDKPQLHCNGQCVLMKKVKEAEKEQNKKNLLVYEYSALYVQEESKVLNMHCWTEELELPQFPVYRSTYAYNYYASVFHPPLLKLA